MPNKGAEICHIAIPCRDLATATAFYQEVFGWEIDWMIPNYPFFKAGNVSGAFDNKVKPALGVMLYCKTDDIRATLAKVLENGGKVIRQKERISQDGDLGYDARFSDPAGNELGLWSDH